MNRPEPSSAEDARQWELLGTAPGEPSSGRVRYAAAMYFHQSGRLGDDCLEVYRTCSVFDHEDPGPVLARLGLIREVEALGTAIGTSRSKRSE